MKASREGSIAESSDTSPDRPSRIVILKTSGRLAAQRAQIAIKRALEDLDPSEVENPPKRTRSDVPAAGEAGESSHTEEAGSSQSTLSSVNVGATQEQPMRKIIEWMDDATEKDAGSTQNTVIKATTEAKPPAGKPLVWANGRGALCEALPYFRAHKGSLHTANVVAQGFLVDQEVDYNDIFGAQVIISSV
jgi:hypothetical protein